MPLVPALGRQKPQWAPGQSWSFHVSLKKKKKGSTIWNFLRINVIAEVENSTCNLTWWVAIKTQAQQKHPGKLVRLIHAIRVKHRWIRVWTQSHRIRAEGPKSKRDRTKSKHASKVRSSSCFSHFVEGCLAYVLGPKCPREKRDGENINSLVLFGCALCCWCECLGC